MQVRLLCQFVNVLDVTVLPPYVPSLAEQADPELYAANVREVYRQASGLPLVEQSQTEFIALCKVCGAASWAFGQLLLDCLCACEMARASQHVLHEVALWRFELP